MQPKNALFGAAFLRLKHPHYALFEISESLWPLPCAMRWRKREEKEVRVRKQGGEDESLFRFNQRDDDGRREKKKNVSPHLDLHQVLLDDGLRRAEELDLLALAARAGRCRGRGRRRSGGGGGRRFRRRSCCGLFLRRRRRLCCGLFRCRRGRGSCCSSRRVSSWGSSRRGGSCDLLRSVSHDGLVVGLRAKGGKGRTTKGRKERKK